MSDDGGLRPEFRKQLGTWQWTSIESPVTGGGIPDSEFCTPDGIQGWIEFKQTHFFNVQIKSLQVAWLMRRCRMGGNAFIGVRRWNKRGVDELWLMRGDQAEALYYHGLNGVRALCWEGGPSNWNFEEVKSVLTNSHL